MRRRLLVIAAMFAIPSLAAAQRGSGGRPLTGDANKSESRLNEAAKGPQLRARDIEDFSTVKLMIDKRKDLQLTDAQVDALKKKDDEAKKQNEPLMKEVDSLVQEMRPPLNPDDAFRAKERSASEALRDKVKAIRANYDAGVQETAGSFSADQQAKWKDFVAKNNEEADKRFREKIGGRSR